MASETDDKFWKKRWEGRLEIALLLLLLCGVFSLAVMEQLGKASHYKADDGATHVLVDTPAEALEAEMVSTDAPNAALHRPDPKWTGGRPIYVITPTYTRPSQLPDMTRLSNALSGLADIIWIVVEDAPAPTTAVANILKRADITSYVQLAIQPTTITEHRGLAQRNLGITTTLDLTPVYGHGVVQFADDDNTYDPRLYPLLRAVATISVYPVGIISRLNYEGPRCIDGKIINFRYAWEKGRTYAVDMAGMAVTTELLSDTHASFDPYSDRGFMESDFVSQLVSSADELDTLGDDCRTILVWHTQTKEPSFDAEPLRDDEDFDGAGGMKGVPPSYVRPEELGSSNKAHGKKPDRRKRRKPNAPHIPP